MAPCISLCACSHTRWYTFLSTRAISLSAAPSSQTGVHAGTYACLFQLKCDPNADRSRASSSVAPGWYGLVPPSPLPEATLLRLALLFCKAAHFPSLQASPCRMSRLSSYCDIASPSLSCRPPPGTPGQPCWIPFSDCACRTIRLSGYVRQYVCCSLFGSRRLEISRAMCYRVL